MDDPSRLASISGKNLRAGQSGAPLAYPDFEDLRQARSFQDMTAFFQFMPATISSGGEPQRYWGSMVTANYFDVVRPAFAAGRGFDAVTGRPEGKPPVVVLSYELWRSRFARRPRHRRPGNRIEPPQSDGGGSHRAGFPRHGSDVLLGLLGALLDAEYPGAGGHGRRSPARSRRSVAAGRRTPARRRERAGSGGGNRSDRQSPQRRLSRHQQRSLVSRRTLPARSTRDFAK